VGLLVDLGLRDETLLARFTGPWALPAAGRAQAAAASTSAMSDRGDLMRLRVIGWYHRALEVNVNVFHNVKVSNIGTVGID